MEVFAKQSKLVIGMVGLPGRGKTYLSRKLKRYLNWQGINCEVFNIGEYRRKIVGTKECIASFFDPNNEEGSKAREECKKMALNDLVEYFRKDGHVAIFDGTNLTSWHRGDAASLIHTSVPDCKIIWVESIVEDEQMIQDVINRSIQAGNPDYQGIDIDQAKHDFVERIDNLAKIYEEVSTEKDGKDTPFIKLYDFSRRVNINCITGFVETKIVSFLMNLHLTRRPIYFSRHGESEYNIDDRIGGDPDLTQRGYAFAAKLNAFFQGELKANRINKKTKFFTSTLRRAVITSSHVKVGIEPTQLKILDEINAGICDGLTYKELDEKFPMDASERKTDKLRYRYPRGESYLDLIQRVEPILFEIERSREPVIVVKVAHQAVIRCLYAYFSRHEFVEVPHISVPLHTVIRLETETYFFHEFRYTINVDTGDISEVENPKPLYVEDYRKVDT